MRIQCRLFCVPHLVFLVLVGPAPAQPQAESASRPDWERLLEWLPEDTETVIVSQGPYAFPKQYSDRSSLTEAMQFLPIFRVLGLQDGVLCKDLQGQKILCAIEGSRRFSAPKGLGLFPYEGCQILEFEASAEGAIQKAFRTCQKAGKSIEVAGQPVAVFTEKYECDTWSLFFCRPRPSILLCATDQTYLEQVLKRIGQVQRPAGRALPAELPEWKQVDVKARVWGIRHYRKETAQDDSTTPVGLNTIFKVRDASAIGLVFLYFPESDHKVRVRYLSGSKDIMSVAKENWSDQGFTPDIKRVAPGVIELSSSVSKDERAMLFWLVLLGHLGHAIVI